MKFGDGLPGVVPSTAPAQRQPGKPKTVKSIFKMEQFMVEFFDEAGDSHIDVFIKVGDNYYGSPNGEKWCSDLRPMQKWVANEVHKRISAREKGVDPSDIPDKDSVNVVGEQIRKATEDTVASRQG